MMTADEFLAVARSLEIAEVRMPDDSVTLHVRELSALERDRFEISVQEDKNVRGRLVLMSACDQNGVRMFRDEHLDAVSAMPASVIDPIFEAAQRVNRLLNGDMEAIEKNLEAAQGGNSHSD